MLPTLNSFLEKIKKPTNLYGLYYIKDHWNMWMNTDSTIWITSEKTNSEKLPSAKLKSIIFWQPTDVWNHLTAHIWSNFMEKIYRIIYFTIKYLIDLYRAKLDWKYELSDASSDLQKNFYSFWNGGGIGTAESARQFSE